MNQSKQFQHNIGDVVMLINSFRHRNTALTIVNRRLSGKTELYFLKGFSDNRIIWEKYSFYAEQLVVLPQTNTQKAIEILSI